MNEKNQKFLLIFIFLRIIAAFICESYFVPDEQWQSVEVAHKIVFGYGHLTWEWKEGIRSFIFPHMFAILFKILQVVHLDYQYILIIFPRILMAVFLAWEDFIIYNIGGSKAVLTHLSIWASSYFGVRTLSNSFETLLTLLLYYYQSPVFLVVFAFWVRPSSVFSSIYFFDWKKNFTFKNICIGVATVLFLTAYDAISYKLMGLDVPICTPIKFLHCNFIKQVAKAYGVYPFLFYFYSCVPSIFGPLLIMLPKCYKSKEFIFALAFTILMSFSAHKEIRFIAPTIPFIAIAVGKIIPRWFLYFNFVVNGIAFLFLSQFHQIGQTRVMFYLHKNPYPTYFLMPCHATPFYSHLHLNISLDFPKCPYSGYSESRDFLSDPLSFARRIKPVKQIIIYESFAEKLMPWLAENNYTHTYRLFNSYFRIDNIDNSYISVFRKT